MMAMARGHPAGKGSDEEADCIVALCAGPPRRKQARTKIKKAPVFIAAVESCAPLPQRMPRHCKTPRAQMMAMEMISIFVLPALGVLQWRGIRWGSGAQLSTAAMKTGAFFILVLACFLLGGPAHKATM